MNLVPVIVDTREQRPYLFDPSVVSVSRGTLTAGDYSLRGLESVFAIERKSLDDFVNTVIHERDRFKEELEKLRHMEFAAIVVEGTAESITQRRYNSKASPNSVIGLWVSLVTDYRIPTYFLSDRQHAQFFTQSVLWRYWNHHRGDAPVHGQPALAGEAVIRELERPA